MHSLEKARVLHTLMHVCGSRTYCTVYVCMCYLLWASLALHASQWPPHQPMVLVMTLLGVGDDGGLLLC